MSFDLIALLKDLGPYVVGGSGSALAWWADSRRMRNEIKVKEQELRVREQELADARSVKAEETLSSRDRQMYEELRQYCSRLEGRIEKLETQQEGYRLAAEAALAGKHGAELDAQDLKTRLTLIGQRCNNSCGLAGLIVPAGVATD